KTGGNPLVTKPCTQKFEIAPNNAANNATLNRARQILSGFWSSTLSLSVSSSAAASSTTAEPSAELASVASVASVALLSPLPCRYGPSPPNTNQETIQTKPMIPNAPKAQRQPHIPMTHAIKGAATTRSMVEPMGTRLDVSARRDGWNQVCAEDNDIAVASPSAPPRMMRVASSTAAPPPRSIGNCITAQTSPRLKRIQFTEILDARIPVTTETMA